MLTFLNVPGQRCFDRVFLGFVPQRVLDAGELMCSHPRGERSHVTGALGSYELAPAVAARDAREAERREAGIAERVERLRAQPELVLDRLAEMRSVWNGADVEREVRSALGVRSGHDAQIDVATRAVVGASLAIDTDTYTIGRVVSEERAAFEAATTLADRERASEAARAGCGA
jgi:hypothetical protein